MVSQGCIFWRRLKFGGEPRLYILEATKVWWSAKVVYSGGDQSLVVSQGCIFWRRLKFQEAVVSQGCIFWRRLKFGGQPRLYILEATKVWWWAKVVYSGGDQSLVVSQGCIFRRRPKFGGQPRLYILEATKVWWSAKVVYSGGDQSLVVSQGCTFWRRLKFGGQPRLYILERPKFGGLCNRPSGHFQSTTAGPAPKSNRNARNQHLLSEI